MEWQPIETAPRDGTKVLLWYPTLEDHVFASSFENGTWQNGVWTRTKQEPTNWMPLPEPPKDTE